MSGRARQRARIGHHHDRHAAGLRDAGATFPDSGQLRIVGAGNSRINLTANSATVAILALDIDGDGLDDITARLNWADLTEPAGANLADTDGDGMHDSWETAFGLNPNLNDATGDPDNDGFTNIAEYNAGTRPNVADATLPPPPNPGTLPPGPAVGHAVQLASISDIAYSSMTQLVYAAMLGNPGSVIPINPPTGAVGHRHSRGQEPDQARGFGQRSVPVRWFRGRQPERPPPGVADQSRPAIPSTWRFRSATASSTGRNSRRTSRSCRATRHRSWFRCVQLLLQPAARGCSGLRRGDAPRAGDATITPEANVIEFSASAGTLYGYNNETTEFGFRTMAVTASGVTVTDNYTSFQIADPAQRVRHRHPLRRRFHLQHRWLTRRVGRCSSGSSSTATSSSFADGVRAVPARCRRGTTRCASRSRPGRRARSRCSMTVTSEDGQLAARARPATPCAPPSSAASASSSPIGAGLFLAIWWITHWRRSRRRPITARDARHVTERVDAAAPSAASSASSAVVGLGTALSRITGFLRVSALAALGFASPHRRLQHRRTRRRTSSTSCSLGGILTATLVPLYVEHYERDDPRATDAINTVALVVLAVDHASSASLAAPWIIDLYMLAARRPGQGRAAGARHRPAAVVHAADLLLRRHRARHRDAQRPAPVRRGRVRAGAEQRRRHRGAARAAARRQRAADGHERPRRPGPRRCCSASGRPPASWRWRWSCCPPLRHAGARLHWVWEWRHPAVRKLARLSGWTVGYVATNQVAFWVALFLAYGHSGDASVYLAAFTFFQLPHGLFAVSIMTALAPELASRAQPRRLSTACAAQFAMGFRLMGLVVIPAARDPRSCSRARSSTRCSTTASFTASNGAATAETLACVRDRALRVLRVPLHPARLLRDAGHAHAVPPQLPRERRQHRARVRALPGVRRRRASRSSWSIAYIVAMVVALGAMRRRLGRLEGRHLRRHARRGSSSRPWCSPALAWARRHRHRLRHPGPGDRGDHRRPRRRRGRVPRARSSCCRSASSACSATPSGAARCSAADEPRRAAVPIAAVTGGPTGRRV